MSRNDATKETALKQHKMNTFVSKKQAYPDLIMSFI
jgi:hypothetical protein